MLKKIYNKNGLPDMRFSDIANLEDTLRYTIKGSKIKLKGERNRYTCIFRDDRYIIVAKSFNVKKETCQYSIIDTVEMCCNRDNSIFCSYFYLDENDCIEALKRIKNPKDPFDISERGKMSLDDVVEEVWAECELITKLVA